MVDCTICTDRLLINTCSLECGHTYHVDCILEWCKVKRSCPLCLKNVEYIKKQNGDVSHVPVEVRRRMNDEDVDPLTFHLLQTWEEEEELAGLLCYVCKQNDEDDDDLLLLCDYNDGFGVLCNSAAHTYCVGLGSRVPVDPWFCSEHHTFMPPPLKERGKNKNEKRNQKERELLDEWERKERKRKKETELEIKSFMKVSPRKQSNHSNKKEMEERSFREYLESKNKKRIRDEIGTSSIMIKKQKIEEKDTRIIELPRRTSPHKTRILRNEKKSHFSLKNISFKVPTGGISNITFVDNIKAILNFDISNRDGRIFLRSKMIKDIFLAIVSAREDIKEELLENCQLLYVLFQCLEGVTSSDGFFLKQLLDCFYSLHSKVSIKVLDELKDQMKIHHNQENCFLYFLSLTSKDEISKEVSEKAQEIVIIWNRKYLERNNTIDKSDNLISESNHQINHENGKEIIMNHIKSSYLVHMYKKKEINKEEYKSIISKVVKEGWKKIGNSSDKNSLLSNENQIILKRILDDELKRVRGNSVM